MTSDPSDGSKRKKVKVLLRKQIPAPLLSHVSLTDDIEADDRASTTSSTTTPKSTSLKTSSLSSLFGDVKYDPKIPAPLLVGGLSLQVRKKFLGLEHFMTLAGIEPWTFRGQEHQTVPSRSTWR